MNPLNKIKEGVKKQDWDLVCEGYNSMTGQNLPAPTKPIDRSAFVLEVPFSDTTIELFKSCMRQMIDEFEFVQTVIDKPDTEDHAVETSDVLQSSSDDDEEQPEDDDEENVDFSEVTSVGDGVGLYGNKTVLITEQPKPGQIEANKKRAEARVEHNVSRPPPKIHKVECTDCGNPFKTPMKAGGQFGQKCPKCLKSTNRER